MNSVSVPTFPCSTSVRDFQIIKIATVGINLDPLKGNSSDFTHEGQFISVGEC